MRRVTFATLFAGLLAMTLGLGTAAAAPVNNPHAEAFTLDCAGVEIDVIVARGNPAFVVDSTQRLIPHEFNFDLVVVVDSEETVLFEEAFTVGKGKKKGLQDRLVECTLVFELSADDFTDEEKEFIEDTFGVDLDEVDEIIVRGTVKVMMTPAKK